MHPLWHRLDQHVPGDISDHPFGGFGQCGYGREAGKDAIYDNTRTKTVWVNTSEEPMANPFVMP